MLRMKIVLFTKIYVVDKIIFLIRHFLIGHVIFVLIVKKTLSKKKKISFCTRSMRDMKKILWSKIVLCEEIYKFPSNCFFMWLKSSRLYIKNFFFLNLIFYFLAKIYEMRKNQFFLTKSHFIFLETKLLISKRSNTLVLTIFSYELSFVY